MKLFTYLLTLYMLLLSCMPCGDSNDCSEDEKVTLVKQGSHDDHDKDAEHCTPFCVCACCAAPVVQFQQAFVMKALIQPVTINVHPDEFIFSSAGHSIWQPPRLS